MEELTTEEKEKSKNDWVEQLLTLLKQIEINTRK